MPLYPMKEILDDASKRKYGVGCYNCINTEMARACVRAAEDSGSPIIISTAEVLLQYSDFDWVTPVLLSAARLAKVPVAVHLDHAYQVDTVFRGIKAGFGSVMFDGSVLPLEENISVSAGIAKYAHMMGVTLECELGKVGGLEEGEGIVGENLYTDVDEAADFVEKTEADFLAVSIGTTHGVFKEPPKLDLKRLAGIREKVGVPLVLHGGSGLTDDDFRNCISYGISKINIWTDVVGGAINKIREIAGSADYVSISKFSEEAMYEAVMEKIRVFGGVNKA